MRRLLTAAALCACITLLAASCGGSSSDAKGDQVKVPDVTGQDLPTARKTLEGLGFKVKATAPDATFGVVDEDNWVVKSQSVKAGSTSAKDTEIKLTVERPDTPTTTTGGAAAPTTTPVNWTAKVKEAALEGDMRAHVKSAELDGDTLVVTSTWRTGFDTKENNERNAVGLCTTVYGTVWDKDVQVNGSDGAPLAETIPLSNGAGKMCREESSISFSDRVG